MDSGLRKNGYLHAGREADEVSAETEAGTLTGGNTNRGRDRIKDGKHNGGEDGEGGDLIERQSALRDEDSGGGDNKTLDEVLNNAIDNFSKSVAHHDSIFTRKKKCGDATIVLRSTSRTSVSKVVGDKGVGGDSNPI